MAIHFFCGVGVNLKADGTLRFSEVNSQGEIDDAADRRDLIDSQFDYTQHLDFQSVQTKASQELKGDTFTATIYRYPGLTEDSTYEDLLGIPYRNPPRAGDEIVLWDTDFEAITPEGGFQRRSRVITAIDEEKEKRLQATNEFFEPTNKQYAGIIVDTNYQRMGTTHETWEIIAVDYTYILDRVYVTADFPNLEVIQGNQTQTINAGEQFRKVLEQMELAMDDLAGTPEGHPNRDKFYRYINENLDRVQDTDGVVPRIPLLRVNQQIPSQILDGIASSTGYYWHIDYDIKPAFYDKDTERAPISNIVLSALTSLATEYDYTPWSPTTDFQMVPTTNFGSLPLGIFGFDTHPALHTAGVVAHWTSQSTAPNVALTHHQLVAWGTIETFLLYRTGQPSGNSIQWSGWSSEPPAHLFLNTSNPSNPIRINEPRLFFMTGQNSPNQTRGWGLIQFTSDQNSGNALLLSCIDDNCQAWRSTFSLPDRKIDPSALTLEVFDHSEGENIEGVATTMRMANVTTPSTRQYTDRFEIADFMKSSPLITIELAHTISRDAGLQYVNVFNGINDDESMAPAQSFNTAIGDNPTIIYRPDVPTPDQVPVGVVVVRRGQLQRVGGERSRLFFNPATLTNAAKITLGYIFSQPTDYPVHADPLARERMAHRTGGSGIHEYIYSRLAGLYVEETAQLEALGREFIDRKQNPILRGSFSTYTKGWRPGQTFTRREDLLDDGRYGTPEERGRYQETQMYVINVTKEIEIPSSRPYDLSSPEGAYSPLADEIYEWLELFGVTADEIQEWLEQSGNRPADLPNDIETMTRWGITTRDAARIEATQARVKSTVEYSNIPRGINA